uniref:Myelin gene regulatory factor C-terminal domain-containing protein n=1 Tax=Romanomermis culicivorax TaxID=13658 RepID=A0A915JRW8_ROMCU
MDCIAGGQMCRWPTVPTGRKRTRDMWELPVGLFIDSYYTFRIGSSTTVVQSIMSLNYVEKQHKMWLCSMPNDEIGASFVEYTLWFYRACDF